jgi:LPXTG-site transpeptidase (sortase) family protein
MLVATPVRHPERLPMRLLSRYSLGVALIGVALLLVACGDDDKKDGSHAGSVTGLATATSTSPGGTPTTPPDSSAPQSTGTSTPKEGTILERLVIPSIQLESPVETRGLNGRGEMEDPGGKDAVAWYNFSEFPGFGGNAVFSGHVDWFTGELGSFGRMKDLKEGDEVIVRMSDGMEMKYKVTYSKLYEASNVDIEDVVGRTEKDSLTFITCEGTFNRSAQDYSHRRIVRAERVS